MSLKELALEALGPLGDPTAREALETAGIEVERGVTSWEGSIGTIRADRITLVLPPSVYEQVKDRPVVRDALEAALAAAVAREPRVSLYEVVLESGTPARGRPEDGGPYR